MLAPILPVYHPCLEVDLRALYSYNFILTTEMLWIPVECVMMGLCVCVSLSPFGGIRLLKICHRPQRRVDSVHLSVRLKPPCFSRVVDVINGVGRDRLVEMVIAKAVPGESDVSVCVSI